MKFYFADCMDTIDPNYNFDTDTVSANRNRQMNDLYAHELFSEPPYDGILVSRSIVGASNKPARYTHGQRVRLFREGIRKFLRFPRTKCDDNDMNYPIMGDCGAYSYVHLDLPPYDIEEILEYYHVCKFTYGVSPDHIILEKNSAWDDSRILPNYIASRAEYTFQTARLFLQLCKNRKLSFLPIGVVQSWSPRSAANYAKKLVDIGYDYIGLGGLAERPTREVYYTIAEVRSKIPHNIKLHVFGINRLDRLEEFQGLGLSSFDSTSPLLKAFKDDKYNYFSPNGHHYLAIKLTQLCEAKLKNRIQSGNINYEIISKLENKCLRYLRAFAKREIDIEVMVELLHEYNIYISPDSDNRKQYRRVLRDRPWEICQCEICKNIGIDVILFRGLNRNKRRGFHNLHVFYNKLKKVKTMNYLTVPCIKTQQNPGKYIYSFIVNGKEVQKFSSISRIQRDNNNKLIGYQRPEIEEHVNNIKLYLERKDSILPNSIVIAFNIKLEYDNISTINNICSIGVLKIPINKNEQVGWIVDGQQRIAAIRQLNRDSFPISVIAFESNTTEDEREQFVLVNNTKPLPKSLVYELLPLLDNAIPPKLKKRQRAYLLLERLNYDPFSPLYYRIKTTTSHHIEEAKIKDMSILKMIENSTENGVLYKFNGVGEKAYKILNNYWSAIKIYYEYAWSLPPHKSRLTHGTGIISMGYVMDAMSYKLSEQWEIPPTSAFLKELEILGKKIPWTDGVWKFSKNIILPWNEIQNTSKHIELLTNYLLRIYKSDEIH